MAQTIRSRCQVFQLGLLDDEVMISHVKQVAADAGLDLSDDVISYVVDAGGGSVRDTLSALDSVVPGVDMMLVDSSTSDILNAIAGQSLAPALAAVNESVKRGRSPRTVGESVVAGLRNAFLLKMGAAPSKLSEKDNQRAEHLANQMAPAAMTRAMETLGKALIDMRQSPDPRMDIEVALVKLCEPEAGGDVQALHHRVDQLESQVSDLKRHISELQGQLNSAHAMPVSPSVSASPHAISASPSATHTSSAVSASPTSKMTTRHVSPSGASYVASHTKDVQSGSHASNPSTMPSPKSSAPNKSSAMDPVAAARQALQQGASSKYQFKRPVSSASRGATPSGSHVSSAPSIPPVPQRPRVDPNLLYPATPTEVVVFAERYLQLDKDTVVERAKSMLKKKPGGTYEPKELLRLWRSLIEESRDGAQESENSSRESAGNSGSADNPQDFVDHLSKADGISQNNSLDEEPGGKPDEEQPDEEPGGKPDEELDKSQKVSEQKSDAGPDVGSYISALSDPVPVTENPMQRVREMEVKIAQVFPGTEFKTLTDEA